MFTDDTWWKEALGPLKTHMVTDQLIHVIQGFEKNKLVT